MEHNTWELSTPFGMFKLRIKDNVLTLGGKDTCVMIVYEGSNDSRLDYLGTEKSCELHGFPVKGIKTQQMLYLATSIFRSVYQDVKFLTILDASTIKCKLPNGSLSPMSLRESHFLFHGKTYYEDKFQAVTLLPEDAILMDEFRKALHDPSKKPKYFNFIDTNLIQELTPYYNSSSTWWEFFQAIQSKWKDDKCTKIYIWYRNALYKMMEGKTIPQYWRIHFKNFPFIHPKFKKISQRGGTRKHRKNIEYYPFSGDWDIGGY